MQIHELTTKPQTNESWGDIAKQAFGQTGVGKQVAGKISAVQDKKLQAQTQQYVQDLSKKWQQVSKSIPTSATPPASTRSQAATRLPATKPSGIPPTPTKPSGPGQMSQTVAGSKVGQRMQQMYGKPKGGIQGMESDIEEAFSDLPGAPAPAPATKAAQIAKYKATKGAPQYLAANNAYRKAFVDWATQQLATRETQTGQSIGLKDVMALPDKSQALSTALSQLVNSRQDPGALDQAVQSYLMTAIMGIQQISREIRAKNPVTQQNQKVIKSTGVAATDAQLKKDGWTVTL
jgi:Tfp pilus assembly protein FimV